MKRFVNFTIDLWFVIHDCDARDGSTRNGNYYCRAPPPCVYPLSTWCNRT